MARMSKISLLILFSLPCGFAHSQTFISDPAYTEFYLRVFDERTNPEDRVAFWWIILELENMNRSREFLRDSLDRYVKHFPDSKHVTLAKSHLAVIERMLHEKRPPDEKRIEQLIFDLREANYASLTHPNRDHNIVWVVPNELKHFRIGKGTAPQQLAEIGYDCVPELIEHIDDKTLTRSVSSGRVDRFSHHVLTVGECCKQILDAIVPTTRTFDHIEDPATMKEAMQCHYLHLIAQANK